MMQEICMFIIQGAHSIQPCLYFYSVNHLCCYEINPSSPCVFLKLTLQSYHCQHTLGLISIFIIHSQSLWSCIGLQLVLLLMELNRLIRAQHLKDRYLEALIAYLNQFLEYHRINTDYLISLRSLNYYYFSMNYVERIFLFH